MEQFVTFLEDFNTRLWRYHIPAPDDVASRFIEDGGNKRVYCQLNQAEKYHAALLKSKEYWFILVNKPLKNSLGLQVGEKVSVQLQKDFTEYGHEMPEEFQVLLDQDKAGNGFFHALTKGKQRSLVYLVTKVKNSNSRINKSLAIVEHLKEMEGDLDFKKLNEKITYYNNLHTRW